MQFRVPRAHYTPTLYQSITLINDSTFSEAVKRTVAQAIKGYKSEKRGEIEAGGQCSSQFFFNAATFSLVSSDRLPGIGLENYVMDVCRTRIERVSV